MGLKKSVKRVISKSAANTKSAIKNRVDLAVSSVIESPRVERFADHAIQNGIAEITQDIAKRHCELIAEVRQKLNIEELSALEILNTKINPNNEILRGLFAKIIHVGVQITAFVGALFVDTLARQVNTESIENAAQSESLSVPEETITNQTETPSSFDTNRENLAAMIAHYVGPMFAPDQDSDTNSQPQNINTAS